MITADSEWLDVLAVMARPDDPAALSDDFVLAVASEVPEVKTAATEAQERAIDRYMDGARAFEGLEDSGGGGAIAGDVLLFLMQMERAGIAEPSQAKARWLAADYARSARHNGSPRVGYSVSAVKGYWRQYKRAAHLWAAFRVIQFEGEPRDHERIGEAIRSDMPRFLGIAKAFQAFADTFHPSRERNPEPVLPSDAWRIADDVPTATLRPPQLEDWATDALARYEHD